MISKDQLPWILCLRVTGALLKNTDSFFFAFLGQHLRRTKIPKLKVKSELQLPTYTPATDTWDPGLVRNLHHSSQHHRIFNPLSEARD